jgi:hypothetical protein
MVSEEESEEDRQPIRQETTTQNRGHFSLTVCKVALRVVEVQKVVVNVNRSDK